MLDLNLFTHRHVTLVSRDTSFCKTLNDFVWDQVNGLPLIKLGIRAQCTTMHFY